MSSGELLDVLLPLCEVMQVGEAKRITRGSASLSIAEPQSLDTYPFWLSTLSYFIQVDVYAVSEVKCVRIAIVETLY